MTRLLAMLCCLWVGAALAGIYDLARQYPQTGKDLPNPRG